MSVRHLLYGLICLCISTPPALSREPGKNITLEVMSTKGVKKGVKKTLTLPWDAISYDISNAYLKSFKRDLSKFVDCQVLKGNEGGKHTGISDIYTFRDVGSTPSQDYVGLVCDLKGKSCGCDD